MSVEYEPFSSLRIIAQHQLYELSKSKKCKVIFDGSGGDEISAGYTYQVYPWLMDLSNDLTITSFKKRFKKIRENLKKNNNDLKEKIFGSVLNYLAPETTPLVASMIKQVN